MMQSDGMSTICGLRSVLVVPKLRLEGLVSVSQLLGCAPASAGVLLTRDGAYFGEFASRDFSAI